MTISMCIPPSRWLSSSLIHLRLLIRSSRYGQYETYVQRPTTVLWYLNPALSFRASKCFPNVWALSAVVIVGVPPQARMPNGHPSPIPHHVDKAAASGEDVLELVVAYALEGSSLFALIIVNVLEDAVVAIALCRTVVTAQPDGLPDPPVQLLKGEFRQVEEVVDIVQVLCCVSASCHRGHSDASKKVSR